MSGSSLLILSGLIPLATIILAWRSERHWWWRAAALVTALVAWLGTLSFVMLHFESAIAYAAINALAPISAAALAANAGLGAVLLLFWGQRALTGGKD